MRSYFHCVTSRFGRRAAVIMTLAGSVSAETAVISFVVLVFGLLGSGGNEFGELSSGIIAAAAVSVTAGMAVCLAAKYIADKKSAMHSRYTFLDIQLKFAVVSIYDGTLRTPYGKEVWRVLLYIPFDELTDISLSRKGVIVRGRLRSYGMDSDSLGYHVRGGAIEFDRWWLGVGCYKELAAAEIPALFGDPQKVLEALKAAKKRFDELPKPKKHEFREADHIRRRPKPRLMPDDLSYGRTWGVQNFPAKSLKNLSKSIEKNHDM